MKASKESLEKRSNYWAQKTCRWIKLKGSEPGRSKNAEEEEKGCYNWLTYNRRKFRDGKSSYPSDLRILRKNGLSGILEKSHRELVSNEAIKRICREILKTGAEPASGSTDYEWLKRRRLNRSTVFFSDQEIANKSGLPNIFSRVPQEMRSNINTHITCKWVVEKGRDPSPHSTDEKEKYLGTWLINRRQAFKGNNTAKFYQSDILVASLYNLANLFDPK